MIERGLLLILFLIGLWGIMANRNVIKKIFGLNIINAAAVILFILDGGRIGEDAAILQLGLVLVSDPVAEALMLTAIVIGVCVTAFSLALAVHLYQVTGTFNIDEIKRSIHDET